MRKDKALILEIKKCVFCKDLLNHSPRPVVSFSNKSKIIIIGQAPGSKVHATGVPWDDASGERLRDWLGVTKEQFYDSDLFGIVPMGFCYPGKGKSGDLPPRPECANLWMGKVLASLKQKEMIILIGQYAQKYFLKEDRAGTLTERVQNWKTYSPDYFVLPHPSPRNNIWMAKNEWFSKEVIPGLKKIIKKHIN